MNGSTRMVKSAASRAKLVRYLFLAAPLVMVSAAESGVRQDPPSSDGDIQRVRPTEDRPGHKWAQNRHRGGDGGGRGYWARMSEAEKTEVLNFMEEHFPQMYLEMQRLREHSPERFNRRIRWIVHDIQEMMDLMEVQPERAALMIRERQLMFEMRRAARRYHRAEKTGEQEKARAEFRELCAQAFDCRHKRRELEIRELEARIAELKQRHAEAEKTREKLIDQEVEEHLSRRPGGPRHGKGRSIDGPAGRGSSP